MDTSPPQDPAPFGHVGHDGLVRSVAYSPDGSQLASAGDDRTVRVWDARTGAPVRVLTDHTEGVLSAVYSPDGSQLASASFDRTVRVWDARTGALIRVLGDHTETVLSVAYSPDGSQLASASFDRTVRVWDSRTGAPIRVLTDHTAGVCAVVYSPDGSLLASGGDDHTVRVWSADTGAQVQVLDGHSGVVRSVAYSADGSHLASASFDGTVRVWDAATGGPVDVLKHEAHPVRAVAYSPDGTQFASGDDESLVRLWDARTYSTLRMLGGSYLDLSFSTDGSRLVTAGVGSALRVWDSRTGALVHELSGHAGSVRSVGYSPDGSQLVSAAYDGTVRSWDARTGQAIRVLAQHERPIWSVVYSPDGSRLAYAEGRGDDGDSTVRVCDAQTGAPIHTITDRAGPAMSVAYSPDGSRLAFAGRDGIARVWDARAPLHMLAGPAESVWSLAYSPDGSQLAAAGSDGTVRLWDGHRGTPILALTGHSAGVTCVAYSSDGSQLASASVDGTVRVWDARTGAPIHVLSGHTGAVHAVSFHPAYPQLASCSLDGTVRLWNTRTGHQLAGTGFGVVLRAMRPLPGIRTDTASTEDLLGIEDDVETLAVLAAAAATQPPLAIALLGEWGAGKSSVMAQMQARIEQLAELSSNNRGLSDLVENVRQVRFNAWHYSDEQLWSGLVAHLFETLAGDPRNAPPARAPTDPSSAHALRAEAERLRGVRLDSRATEERITRQLTAGTASTPSGLFTGLGSPAALARVVRTAAVEAVREVRSWLWLLAGWAVLGTAAYLAWRHLQTPARGLISGVAGPVAVALPPLLVIWQRLRSWHRQGMGVGRRSRDYLEQRRQQVRLDAEQAAARLAEIDAAERLSQLIAHRADPAAYAPYRGLLAQVHRDLTQLSRDLAEAHQQWSVVAAAPPPPARGRWRTGRLRPALPEPMPGPPLQRVILYIDDLDRCPPERVVEVLAAVHLMLAIPLFVVVVAVDPRWLLSCLAYHYQELFTGSARGADQPGEETATPLDYLDKIFQIPFAVPPMHPAAAERYLNALLAAEGSQPSVTPPAPVQASPAVVRPTGHAPTSDPAPADAGPDIRRSAEDPVSSRPAAAFIPEPAGRAEGQRGHDLSGSVRSVLDLRLPGLALAPEEIAFLGRLGPLLATPRAAKKLVNLYRLIRIGIPDAQLASFTSDGTYRVVQVLLAILVGAPAQSPAIFTAILTADPSDVLTTVLANTADDPARESVTRLVTTICRDASWAPTIASFQPWCPQLARYSFHARDLANATFPPGPHERQPGQGPQIAGQRTR